MKITIQFACDSIEEAHGVMKKLAPPHSTWVDLVNRREEEAASNQLKTATSARLDKIMWRETGDTAEKKVDNDSEATSNTTHSRPNVSPGESSIGKIGSSTKKTLLNDLGRSVQPSAKFTEHAKLLWKRGEIKFDGAEYYL